MPSLNLIQQRFIGESRHTKINLYDDLETGQSVLSVVWTVETGSGITVVSGSSDVVQGQQGVESVVRGRFDYTAAVQGQWTLTALCVCANPTENKIGYAIVQVDPVPT